MRNDDGLCYFGDLLIKHPCMQLIMTKSLEYYYLLVFNQSWPLFVLSVLVCAWAYLSILSKYHIQIRA